MHDDRARPEDGLAHFRELMDATRSLEDVVAVLSRNARHIVGSDGIAVVLRDRGFCHYVAEDSLQPLWKGQRFPLKACASGWAMMNDETVIAPDVAVDARVPVAPYQSKAICSLVIAPIGSPEPVAALGAYWSPLMFLGEATVACVESLAREASAALARIRREADTSEALALSR